MYYIFMKYTNFARKILRFEIKVVILQRAKFETR